MKVIVVSHGSFSKGILESLQMIVGEQEGVVALGIDPHEDREALAARLREALEAREDGEEVLIASDLFHGTPFNVCVALSKQYDFHHITGINLPLLIEIIMDRSMGRSAAQICAHVLQDAPGTVKDVRRLLEDTECDEDEGGMEYEECGAGARG